MVILRQMAVSNLQFSPSAGNFFFKIYFVEVQLIYTVVLIFAVQQSDSFFFFLRFNFIYFWLHWVFVAVRGLLIGWLLLLRSTGSRCAGFSSCGT